MYPIENNDNATDNNNEYYSEDAQPYQNTMDNHMDLDNDNWIEVNNEGDCQYSKNYNESKTYDNNNINKHDDNSERIDESTS